MVQNIGPGQFWGQSVLQKQGAHQEAYRMMLADQLRRKQMEAEISNQIALENQRQMFQSDEADKARQAETSAMRDKMKFEGGESEAERKARMSLQSSQQRFQGGENEANRVLEYGNQAANRAQNETQFERKLGQENTQFNRSSNLENLRLSEQIRHTGVMEGQTGAETQLNKDKWAFDQRKYMSEQEQRNFDRKEVTEQIKEMYDRYGFESADNPGGVPKSRLGAMQFIADLRAARTAETQKNIDANQELMRNGMGGSESLLPATIGEQKEQRSLVQAQNKQYIDIAYEKLQQDGIPVIVIKQYPELIKTKTEIVRFEEMLTNATETKDKVQIQKKIDSLTKDYNQLKDKATAVDMDMTDAYRDSVQSEMPSKWREVWSRMMARTDKKPEGTRPIDPYMRRIGLE